MLQLIIYAQSKVAPLLQKEEVMQSVSLLDLQVTAPSTLRKKLISEEVLVVTVNNKPFAAMISLDEVKTQDITLMVSRLRAHSATLSIRNQAHKNGTNRTTLKEVSALIKRTRLEKKQIKQAHQS